MHHGASAQQQLTDHLTDPSVIVVSRSGEPISKEIDLNSPSTARVCNYLAGGTTNWAVDRQFVRLLLQRCPEITAIELENRLFRARAIRYLLDAGVRQFVDLGSGVPTLGSTHEVAGRLVSDTRVAYVDHDPMANAHTVALLRRDYTGAGPLAVVKADLRDPDSLWTRVAETGVIDPDQPVALLMLAVLDFQQRDVEGREIGEACTDRLRELLPRGSFLIISHRTTDGVPPELAERLDAAASLYERYCHPFQPRTRQEITRLFGDFTIIEPGATWTSQWRPDLADGDHVATELERSSATATWCGLGLKV